MAGMQCTPDKLPDTATDTDLQAAWTQGTGLLSAVPNGYFTQQQLTDPNLDTTINNTIQSLITNNVIPPRVPLNQVDSVKGPATIQPSLGSPAPQSVYPAQGSAINMRTFQDNVKSEYCWYQARYFTAVQKFLNLMTNPSTQNDVAVINTARDLALKLNLKTNTMIVLMYGLAKMRYTDVQSMGGADGQGGSINVLNMDLKNVSDQLRKQAMILQENSTKVDIHKRMVEFTTEKNLANQNLLALYFVLNVVAITSLFIIARST